MTVIDEQIAVLQAYKEGKTIEYRCHDDYDGWSEWYTVKGYGGSPYNFNFSNEEYRIAKEPEYRPYEYTKEIVEAIKQHGSFIKSKTKTLYYNIIWFEAEYVSYGISGLGKESYKTVFENYVWADDGSPCGVKID